MRDPLTPEDERAISDSVEQRRRQAELDAEAAQPKCCSLWWQRHTRDCPNRTYDAEWAEFGRWIKRLGGKIMRGIAR